MPSVLSSWLKITSAPSKRARSATRQVRENVLIAPKTSGSTRKSAASVTGKSEEGRSTKVEVRIEDVRRLGAAFRRRHSHFELRTSKHLHLPQVVDVNDAFQHAV